MWPVRSRVETVTSTKRHSQSSAATHKDKVIEMWRTNNDWFT
jgi:hypothetical protein